jgi:Arc/MetJ family transcription regulator
MPRLQLDLSDTDDELISRLIDICDLSTKKDVVQNALMMLGWAATEVQHGRGIAAVDEANKVYKELQTPALLGARHWRERVARREREPAVARQAS